MYGEQAMNGGGIGNGVPAVEQMANSDVVGPNSGLKSVTSKFNNDLIHSEKDSNGNHVVQNYN